MGEGGRGVVKKYKTRREPSRKNQEKSNKKRRI